MKDIRHSPYNLLSRPCSMRKAFLAPRTMLMNIDLLTRELNNRSTKNPSVAEKIKSDYMGIFIQGKKEERIWGLNPGTPFTAPCSFIEPTIEKQIDMNPRTIVTTSDLEFQNALMCPKVKDALLNLLGYVVQILRENDIRYWITGGTLLGAVRHKGFIPHDDDVDICIDQRDEEKLLKAFQFPLYLEYNPIFGYKTYSSIDSKEVLGRTCYGIFVDFFMMRATTTAYEQVFPEARKLWPAEYWLATELFPLKSYRFVDLWVSGPANPTAYLRRMYGPDCLKYCLIPPVLHGRLLSRSPLKVPLYLMN